MPSVTIAVGVRRWRLRPPLPPPIPLERARLHLRSLLLRDGLLSPEQIEEALAVKEQTGARLGEIVVERGWLDSADLARALAEQHGLDYVDLAGGEMDQAAAVLLSARLAHRYGALPVRFLDEETILVAVSDPTDVLTSDDLRLALGLNVRIGAAAATWRPRARPRSSWSTSSSPARSTRAPPISTSSHRRAASTA